MSKLYRGRKTNGDWEKGFAFSLPSNSKTQRLNPNKAYILSHLSSVSWSDGSGYTLGNFVEVDKETVGECTSIPDQMGRMIYEGDILEGVVDNILVRCLVCVGEYNQDGSGGEYPPVKCHGTFVKVLLLKDMHTGNEGKDIRYYECYLERNLLEVASQCNTIGNIHDNPELFEQQEVSTNA